MSNALSISRIYFMRSRNYSVVVLVCTKSLFQIQTQAAYVSRTISIVFVPNRMMLQQNKHEGSPFPNKPNS